MERGSTLIPCTAGSLGGELDGRRARDRPWLEQWSVLDAEVFVQADQELPFCSHSVSQLYKLVSKATTKKSLTIYILSFVWMKTALGTALYRIFPIRIQTSKVVNASYLFPCSHTRTHMCMCTCIQVVYINIKWLLTFELLYQDGYILLIV